MPTGYTEHILNGDITTGKDFLKLCTRAFGIAIDMKDKQLSIPTPTYFEPDPYYKNRYDVLVKVRDKHKQLSFDEAKQEIINDYKENKESARKILDKCISEDDKYMKIRNEIEKWIPPTSEHENLKKFALEQIDISLNTSIREFYNKELSKPLDVRRDTVYDYIKDKEEAYDRNVASAYRHWQEETKQVVEKNLWMKQFIDSLENM